MYTTTISTPLANGVTPEKLARVLQHHRAMLDVLAPGATTTSSDEGDDGSVSTAFVDPEKAVVGRCTYGVAERGAWGRRRYTIEFAARADGCETVMRPGRARMSIRWTAGPDVLVEEVRIEGGCWSIRQAKKRLLDHERQHGKLMQLAATSKSMTGSFDTDADTME